MASRIKISTYFALTIICILTVPLVSAQSSNLLMETERHWETYGVGGTCNHGTHNLFLSDVDNDCIVEIISGAFQYDKDAAGTWGVVDILSWDGQNITVENTETYLGNVECVYAADADGDGVKEIFTGGLYSNQTGVYPTLRVWRLNDNGLSLVAHHEGVAVAAIFVADLDRTGNPEIITVGELADRSDYTSEICVWDLQQNGLVIRQDLKLRSVSPISVCAYDLNGDNETEIITAGYSNSLNNSQGQLQVWSWSNEGLLLKAEKTWRTVADEYARNIAGGVLGNTVVNNVKVGDVDGDGVLDIVTGGFTYDAEKVKAQLIVWNLYGEELSQKEVQEWATDSITIVYSLSINDVDKDGKLEIVTGGMLSEFNSFKSNGTSLNRAELTIWGWSEGALALEQSENWTVGEGVCVWNVGTADLENDGTVEIITEGCMSYERLCDPDLRIWSVKSAIDNSAYTLVAIVGIALGVLAVGACALLVRRRKVKSKP